MKKIFALTIVLASAVFSKAQQSAQPTGDQIQKLNWLAGMWNRTNGKPGRAAHERWEKISTNEWIGFGVTMTNKDTVFVEKLKIVVQDNFIYYVADVPENKKPVYFKFTSLTENGFACENPEHDFPKKIEYNLEGNKLKARISGNGKSIDYLFEK